MSNQVNLGFKADATGVNNKLTPVLNKLKEMAKAYKEIKNMKITVDIDNTVLKANDKFKRIEDTLNRIKDTNKKLTAENKELKQSYSDLNNKMKENNKNTEKMAKNIMSVAVAYRALRSIQNIVKDQIALESAVYNVGVASQMTLTEIKGLRVEFTNLSKGLPSTALELAKVSDMLVRTGKTFEEAIGISEKASKLAVASGDDLQSTAKVVNKILVALKIDVDNLDEAFNALHSTALQSPTTLGELGDSFKGAGGALGAFIETTSRSRDELEAYKQEILEVSSASIGAFRSQGRSATQAGIHMRILASSMVAMQKSGQEVFNTAVEGYKVLETQADGTGKMVQLTANQLSKMAQEDLPKAIELMSTLYTDGILSMQDVLKIFTKRHGLYIALLFDSINGNLDEFTDSIASGVSYLDDFNKQMEKTENQLSILQNKFKALAENEGILSMKNTTNAIAGLLNAFLDNEFYESVATLAVNSGMFLTAMVASKAVFAKLIPMALSFAGITASTLATMSGIGVAVMAIVYAVDTWMDSMRAVEEEAMRITDAYHEQRNAINDNESALGQLNSMQHRIATTDISAPFINASYVIAGMLANFERVMSLAGSVGSLTDYSPASLEQLEGEKVGAQGDRDEAVARYQKIKTALAGMEKNKDKYGFKTKREHDAYEKLQNDLKEARLEVASTGTALMKADTNLTNARISNIQKLEQAQAESGSAIEGNLQETLGKTFMNELELGEKSYEDFANAYVEKSGLIGDEASKLKKSMMDTATSSNLSVKENAEAMAVVATLTESNIRRLNEIESLQGNTDEISKAKIKGLQVEIETTNMAIEANQRLQKTEIALANASSGGGSSKKSSSTERTYAIEYKSVLSDILNLRQQISLIGLTEEAKMAKEVQYAQENLDIKREELEMMRGLKSSELSGLGVSGTTEELLAIKQSLELAYAKGGATKNQKAIYDNIVDLLKIENELQENSLEKKKAKAEYAEKLREATKERIKEQIEFEQQMSDLKASQFELGLDDPSLNALDVNKYFQDKVKNEMEMIKLQDRGLTDNEKAIALEEKKLELMKLQKEEAELITEERMKPYEQMMALGSGISSFGNQVGSDTISGLGGIMSAGGGLGKAMSSFSAGGGMASLGSMAGMMSGMGVVSAGLGLASAIGGMLSKDDSEEKNAEAEAIWNENNEQLRLLNQNMSALNENTHNLTSTLTTAFSKIPTVDKLTTVLGNMANLNMTMLGTRDFPAVAWQEMHKGSSGFMGIGASAGYTETHIQSAQSVARELGYGAISGMTIEELDNFADDLRDYNKGTGDNFSMLADGIDSYSSALKESARFQEEFFRDTTFEGFSGVEQQDQIALVEELTSIYEGLGYVITDELSENIDKMAEEMKVSITAMHDVRNSFVSMWAEGGTQAGEAFASSMESYFVSIRTNLSQVYYDTIFSGATTLLEKEFENISNQLLLFKQSYADGTETGSIADSGVFMHEFRVSFENIVYAMKEAKDEADDFDNILKIIQMDAEKLGLTLKDMWEFGLLTGTQESIVDAYTQAVNARQVTDGVQSFGDTVGSMIADAMSEQLLSKTNTALLDLANDADKILSGSYSMTDLTRLANQTLSAGIQAEIEREKLEAQLGLFDFDSDVVYNNATEDITYTTGTTSSQIYNYNLSTSVTAGNVIGLDDIETLVEIQIDTLITKLKIEKGIDLTSN